METRNPKPEDGNPNPCLGEELIKKTRKHVGDTKLETRKPKPENQNPESERNPKPEIRNQKLGT